MNGAQNITMHYLILRTLFLSMWDLQILLFGLWDSLVRSPSKECQLCEDNATPSPQYVCSILPHVGSGSLSLTVMACS